jgi:MFS family permease
MLSNAPTANVHWANYASPSQRSLLSRPRCRYLVTSETRSPKIAIAKSFECRLTIVLAGMSPFNWLIRVLQLRRRARHRRRHIARRYAYVSSAMTIGFVALAVTSMVWGPLSDRWGPRPVALIGSVVLAGALAWASRATVTAAWPANCYYTTMCGPGRTVR